MGERKRKPLTVKRWHEIVLRWLAKRARAKKPQPPKRFSHELDSYIHHAKKGSTRHALGIVAYFYWADQERTEIDPRVLNFLKAARRRYLRDPRQNIAKALWLVRPRRGNPGGVSAKRRLTPEGHIEAALMVREKRLQGSEKRAIADVAAFFNVSPRTVRNAVQRKRRERRERD